MGLAWQERDSEKMNSSDKAIAVGPGFRNGTLTHVIEGAMVFFSFGLVFWFCVCVCVCCNKALFIDTETQILCNFHVTKYHCSFDFFPNLFFL